MAHPPPGNQRELYASLMEEVNARLETISFAVQGTHRMHEMLAEEFCYFQLRLICEIVACGCLIAHGDLTGINLDKYKREWSADSIIKKLDKLHQDFYPKPRIVTRRPERIDLQDRICGFLTKTDLLQLYGITHSRTHRGPLMGMTSRAPYVNVDFKPVTEWAAKIELLLNDHIIQSLDEKHTWLVIPKAPETGGHSIVVDVWL
jgi:hypothetical protein